MYGDHHVLSCGIGETDHGMVVREKLRVGNGVGVIRHETIDQTQRTPVGIRDFHGARSRIGFEADGHSVNLLLIIVCGRSRGRSSRPWILYHIRHVLSIPQKPQSILNFGIRNVPEFLFSVS